MAAEEQKDNDLKAFDRFAGQYDTEGDEWLDMTVDAVWLAACEYTRTGVVPKAPSVDSAREAKVKELRIGLALLGPLTEEDLATCLQEIKDWEETAVLRDGQVREIAEEAVRMNQQAGLEVSLSNALKILRESVVMEAAYRWLGSR